MTEGYLELDGGRRRTWYRATGARTDRPPLLMLHGGPGSCTGDDLLAVEHVARDRQVIEYDQLDCGRSSRVGDPGAWTVEGHLRELAQVRAALDLREVHLWGVSWGGALAVSHVLAGADGVVSLTMASAPVCWPRWIKTAARYRTALPGRTQRALDRCERTVLDAKPRRVKPGPGPTSDALRKRAAVTARVIPRLSSPAVQWSARLASYVPPLRRAAYPVLSIELLRRHLFRGDTWPVGMMVGHAGMNTSVYETMWGPSEFAATGPLKDFDVTSQLPAIDVPVLVTSGAHEFASPDQMADLVAAIPGARWELFEDCAHAGAYEEPERYAAILRDFLLDVDRSRIAC